MVENQNNQQEQKTPTGQQQNQGSQPNKGSQNREENSSSKRMTEEEVEEGDVNTEEQKEISPLEKERKTKTPFPVEISPPVLQ